MQPSNARVAKMKGGHTHLAPKAEHAVDLDTGAGPAGLGSHILQN
jgi:hypothetical protein